MSHIYNQLQELIKSVPNNTTKRFICPFCNKLNTFNISNFNSVIKYHCFSDSCNKSSGYVKNIPDTEELINILNNTYDKDVKFIEPPYFISGLAHKDVFQFINNHNGMRSWENGNYSVEYDKAEHRIVYLLKDKLNVVGAIGRTLYKYFNPKVKIYENSVIMPFIVGKMKQVAVIVEDCASACAVNSDSYLDGFALLGTTFKNEYIPYLEPYKKVYIALDPDARKKALEIRNFLTYVHKDVRILDIPKDIKNMTEVEWLNFRLRYIYVRTT